MKTSTVNLLKLVERFYKAAAKLQLEGPGFPQDPNFTGLSNQPNYKASPVDVPEAELQYPKDLASGELPKNKFKVNKSEIVIQYSQELLKEIGKFYKELLTWAVNPQNNYRSEIKSYRFAISIVNSLQELIEDVISEAHANILDSAKVESKVTDLNRIFEYFGTNTMLFDDMKSFDDLYQSLYLIGDRLLESVGRLPPGTDSAYDMFAEEDAEEDAAEQATQESGEQLKPGIVEDSDEFNKIFPKEEPSLSFNFEPMKF